MSHENVIWESGYVAAPFLTSALDGGEWSVSRPGRFTLGERAPGTHWIECWVGPRAGLDAHYHYFGNYGAYGHCCYFCYYSYCIPEVALPPH
jgi:hypothetical protein